MKGKGRAQWVPKGLYLYASSSSIPYATGVGAPINVLHFCWSKTCLDSDLLPQWVQEQQCSYTNTTKRDVFVFEEFKGDIFNQLQKQKCIRLLGPRCLTSCLIGKYPIPESNSPVFTTAMRGLIITTTNFKGSEKEDLIKKVQYMGGLYSINLVMKSTHLIAKDVLSVKYEERNISMLVSGKCHVFFHRGFMKVLKQALQFLLDLISSNNKVFQRIGAPLQKKMNHVSKAKKM
ncbi:hypothetical protein C0J52_04216 [Blattella germanica]|nr:hypothetical protein C0J52_04216 [Blattella germanica]